MCDLDLESCTVFDETLIKKAKKDHKCDCCDGPIPKGTSYLKHFSVYDGSVTCEKQCPACTTMVQEFTKVHKQHTNPSYMPELLRECMVYEHGEGNLEMANKWKAELQAMKVRSGKPLEETDDGEDEDEGDEEEGEAGDDQGGQGGRN